MNDTHSNGEEPRRPEERSRASGDAPPAEPSTDTDREQPPAGSQEHSSEPAHLAPHDVTRALLLIYGAQGIIALLVIVAAGLVSLFGAGRLVPGPELTVPAALLCMLWGVGVIWYYGAKKHGAGIAKGLGVRKPTRTALIISGALGVSGAAVGALIAIKYSEERSLFAGLFTGAGPETWVAPVTALLIGLLPLYDELLYRGLIFRALRAYVGPAAIPLAALCFGLSYLLLEWGNWGGLLIVALLGLCWSVLRWTYGSLAPSLLGHAIYTWLLPILVYIGGGR